MLEALEGGLGWDPGLLHSFNLLQIDDSAMRRSRLSDGDDRGIYEGLGVAVRLCMRYLSLAMWWNCCCSLGITSMASVCVFSEGFMYIEQRVVVKKFCFFMKGLSVVTGG